MKKKDLQKKKKDNESHVNRSDSNMAGKSKKKEESKAKPLNNLNGGDELKGGNGGRVTRHSKKVKVYSEEEHVESVDLVESADGAAKQKKPGKEMPVRTTRSRMGAEVVTVGSSPVKKTRSGGANAEKDDGVKKDVTVPVRTTRSRAGADMPVILTSPVGKKRRRGELDAENDKGMKEIHVLTTRSKMGADVANLPSSPVEKKKRRIGGLDTESTDGVEKEIPLRATRSRGGVELATLHSSPVKKEDTHRRVKAAIQVKKDVQIRTTRSRMDAEIVSLPSHPAGKKKTKGARVNIKNDSGVKNEIPVRTTRSRAGGEIAVLPSFSFEEKETRRGVKTNNDDGVKKDIPVRTTRSRMDVDIASLPSSTIDKKKTRRTVETENDDGVEMELLVQTRSRMGGESASIPLPAPLEKKKTTRGGVNTDNDVGVKEDIPVRATRSRTGPEEAILPSSAVEKKKTIRGLNTENEDGVETEMPVRPTRSRTGGEVASVPSAPVEKKKTRRGRVNPDSDVGVEKDIPVRTTRSRTGAEEANLPSSPVEKKKTTRGVNTENDDGDKKGMLVQTRSRVGVDVASAPFPAGKKETRRRAKTDNADGVKMEIPVRKMRSRVGPEVITLPPSPVEKTKTSGRKARSKEGFKKTSDDTNEENVVQITRSLRGKEIQMDREDTNLNKTNISSRKRKREATEDGQNEDNIRKAARLKKNTRQTRKKGDEEEGGKVDIPLDKDITDIRTVKKESKNAPRKDKAEKQSKTNASTSDNFGKRDSENVSKPEPQRRSRRASPTEELVNLLPNVEKSAQSKTHIESDYPAKKSPSIGRPGKMVSKPVEHKLDTQAKVEFSPQKLAESSYKTVPSKEAPEDATDKLVVPATEEIVAAEHASPLNSPIHKLQDSADDSLVVTEMGSTQVDNETARLGCKNEGDLETIGSSSALKKATDLSTSTAGIAKIVSESNSLEEEVDHIEIQVIQVEQITDMGKAAEEAVNVPGEISHFVMESEIRDEEASPFSEEISPMSAGETIPECNISGVKNVGEESEKDSVKVCTSSLEDKIIHHEHGKQAHDHVLTSEADNVKLEELVDKVSTEDFSDTHLEISVGEFVGEVPVFQEVNDLGQRDPSVAVGSPTGAKDVSTASCINSVFTYNEAQEVTEANEVTVGALEFNSEDVEETSIVKSGEVLEEKVEETIEEYFVCNSDKLDVRVSCEVNEKNKTLDSSVEGFGEDHVTEGVSTMFQVSQELYGEGVIKEHHHCGTSSPVSQGNIGLDFEDVSEVIAVESQEGLEQKFEEIREEKSDCNTDKHKVHVSCEVVEKNATLEAPVEKFGQEHASDDAHMMFQESADLLGERKFGEEHASEDASTMFQESADVLGECVISGEHHDCDTSSVKTLSSPVSISKVNIGIGSEDVSEASIVKGPEVLEGSIKEFREENCDCDLDTLNEKVSIEVDEKTATPEASVVRFGTEQVREEASTMIQKSPDLLGKSVMIEEHHDCDTRPVNVLSTLVSEAQTPGAVGFDFEDVVETSFVKNEKVLEEKIEEVSEEDIIRTSVANKQEVLVEKVEQFRDENSDCYSEMLNLKISSQDDEKNEILEALAEEFGEEHVHKDASAVFQEPIELHGEIEIVEEHHDGAITSIKPLSSPLSHAHTPGNPVVDFEDDDDISSVKRKEVSEEKNEEVRGEDVKETSVVKSQEVLEEKMEEDREENPDYNRDKLVVKVSCEVDEKNENLEALGAEQHVREDASTRFQELPDLLTKNVMIEDHCDYNTSSSKVSDSAASQALNLDVEEFEFQDSGENSTVNSREVLEKNIEESREERCDGNSDKLNVKASCEVDEKNETLEASSAEEVDEERVPSIMFQESQELLGGSLAIEEHSNHGTTSIETLSSPVWQAHSPGNVGLDIHDVSEATVAKSLDVLEENIEEVGEQNSDCNLDEQYVKVSCEIDEKNESLEASEEFGEERVREEDASNMLPVSQGAQNAGELDSKDVGEAAVMNIQEFVEETIEDLREESYDRKVSCEDGEKIGTSEELEEEFGEEQVSENASMMFQETPEYPGESVIVEEHRGDSNVTVSVEVDDILEAAVEEAVEKHVREDALTRFQESLELLGKSSVEEFGEEHVKQDASMLFQESPGEYSGKSDEYHSDENCDNKLNVQVSCELDEEMENLEGSVEELGEEGHAREDGFDMFHMSPEEHPDEVCDIRCDVETEILGAASENVKADASMMFQMSPKVDSGKSLVIEEHPNEICESLSYEERETFETSGDEYGEVKVSYEETESLEKVRGDGTMMFEYSSSSIQTVGQPASQQGNVEFYLNETSFSYQGEGIVEEELREEDYLEKQNVNVEEDASMMFPSVDIEDQRDCDTSVVPPQDNVKFEANLPATAGENNDWSPF